MLEDKDIVELYWQRNQDAVQETREKYETYLMKIAYNILFDEEDCRESVNDTYFGAWNSMPQHRPEVLKTFLSKIVRRSSIDIFRKRNSQKRKSSEYALSLEELGDCVPAAESAEQFAEAVELAETIAEYLRNLSEDKRNIFVQRYYFMDSIADIASYYGVSRSKIESQLFRVRKGLRQYLEKEGWAL